MTILKHAARAFSRFLARNPLLLFKIQESWLRFGYSALDLSAASWVIRRPEWLRVKPANLLKRLEPASSSANAEGARAIARRGIAAFQTLISGEDEFIPAESMWGSLRQSHLATLRSLVEQGDADQLAKYQERLFRTEAVNGFTYGTTFDAWPHRWHYLPLLIELSVVQLAEAIGVLRAECHEQGKIAFWRSLLSEEELINSVEEFFGCTVEHPRCGDPHGIMFGGRFLTRETCSHLYSAYRMRTAIERHGLQLINLVEIGGGFGGTCFWLRKLMGDRIQRYVIVDLPEVSLIQAFFLGSTDPETLVLWGENKPGDKPYVELIPHTALTHIDFQPNVVVNQDSMPEMPLREVERYLVWASEKLDGLFISFNQETLSSAHGRLQICVPEAVRLFTGFRRVSRDTSWDRRGYVEEVYESARINLSTPHT